jgi:hypothetical protein
MPLDVLVSIVLDSVFPLLLLSNMIRAAALRAVSLAARTDVGPRFVRLSMQHAARPVPPTVDFDDIPLSCSLLLLVSIAKYGLSGLRVV